MQVFASILNAARRAGARLAVFSLLAVALAACNQTFPGAAGPTDTQADAGAIGSGSVKVALLLPMTGSGNAGVTGQAMRNAAEMAISDIPDADLQLLPFDTRGTPEGAQAAAQQAVSSGARLVIGPVFSGEVRAAAGVVRSGDLQMVAFSSDVNVAAPGVYLLSFLPEDDINRIVGYAVRNGQTSLAALLPQNTYGSVIEAAFQQAAAASGARVIAIERYGQDEAQMRQAVERITTVAGGNSPQVEAVLMPDGRAALQTLAPMLAERGISAARVRLLGSGQWNDPSAWRIPQLAGGWFAAPDPSGWQGFRNRYKGRYGSEPTRNATLAYDAVSLAAALGRSGGENRYSAQALTNPDGFAGVDGVFRFRQNGTNERGLAILEIQNGNVSVRDPAPRTFGAGT